MWCYYNIVLNIHKKKHHADDQFAEWLSPSLNKYVFAGSKVNGISGQVLGRVFLLSGESTENHMIIQQGTKK